MEKAERLTRWLVRETLTAYRFFGFIKKPIQLQEDEKIVLATLEEKQKVYSAGMTFSDIKNAAPRFKRSTQRLKDALNNLVKEKKINVERVVGGNNRPAQRYSLK